MVEELGSDYSEIAKSHCSWIMSSVVILIVTSILGSVIGPELSGILIQKLLSILVTTVATVLAITFSVLFISTQIASERYSPKFTVSFVNDPIVQLSFGLGIFSIISNLAMIAVSPSLYRTLGAESNGTVSLLLWTTGGFLLGFSIVFFLLLYPFIRLILIQTTPENILSQFERQYDAARFRKEAENAGKISNHPMQPVYDFARNAMKRGDYNAAISAVETLYQIPQNLLPELIETKEIHIESVFGPVIIDYGRPLINQADDSNFSDVVSTASEGMIRLGTEAISADNKRIYDETFSTSYSLFEHAAQFRDETNLVIVECCSKLYSAAAKKPQILEEYIPRQAQLVSDVVERGSISQMEKCLEETKNTHNIHISSTDSSSSEIRREEVLLGYKDKKPIWNRRDEKDQPLLLKCMFLMMQSTGSILTLCGDASPPGFVYETWESAIEEAHAKGFEIHLEHLIRRYIEILVYVELNYQSGLSAPNRVSGIVTDDHLQESVSHSCDSIINENRPLSEINKFQFLEWDLTEIWKPIPMAEYSDDFITEVNKIKNQIRSS